MELFINDTPIGVSPQISDTLQDLLNTITKELEEDLIIATMLIDGKYCSTEDPAILGQLISSIKKIELTVATRTEICLSLLEDGKNFIIIGSQELKNGSLAKKSELISSFAWILESLEALRGSLAFPPTDLPILKAILTEVVKQLDDDRMSIHEAKDLGEKLETIINLFDVLQHKLINEDSCSKENVLDQMQVILPLLPEIAENFQQGKDLHAIQELCKIIDLIEMYVRLAASQPSNDQMHQHANTLKDISLQLLHAFENKDFILIADLIEYDLTEHLEVILEN
ncbi:MAG: hypothetical protein ACRCWI_07565 [Brevinema sp.]